MNLPYPKLSVVVQLPPEIFYLVGTISGLAIFIFSVVVLVQHKKWDIKGMTMFYYIFFAILGLVVFVSSGIYCITLLANQVQT